MPCLYCGNYKYYYLYIMLFKYVKRVKKYIPLHKEIINNKFLINTRNIIYISTFSLIYKELKGQYCYYSSILCK